VCVQDVGFAPSRSTGKERDAESGNDYFGARYYASSMGRFLSPDWSAKVMPVPYAKLDNPQSLNLYAYVGNNPLSRNDPSGHYWCPNGKGGSSCGQDVKDMVAGIGKAASALPEGSAKRNTLEAVSKFYGDADTKNGVTVNVGTVKGAEATTFTKDGQTTITFDMKKMNADFSKSSSPDVEKTATAAHEGEHGLQQQAEGMPHSLIGDFRAEFGAFRVQSYVNEALGVNSVYGVWDKTLGWDANKAASYAYDEAVDYCSNKGVCK
jgi:RHS repeat-associated protein